MTLRPDWNNVAKGLVVGLSAIYGATRVSDYAIEQIQQRLDRQSAYFQDQIKQVDAAIQHGNEVQDARVAREFDQLRHDIYELRDRDSKRAR